MKKIILYCDRCKKECEKLFIICYIPEFYSPSSCDRKKAEVCEKCSQEITKFIENGKGEKHG